MEWFDAALVSHLSCPRLGDPAAIELGLAWTAASWGAWEVGVVVVVEEEDEERSWGVRLGGRGGSVR